MSFFIVFQFALLYKGMIRGFCFSLTGLKSNSVYTISLSDTYHKQIQGQRSSTFLDQQGHQEKPKKTTQIIQKEE
jgi:hypothetical protein